MIESISSNNIISLPRIVQSIKIPIQTNIPESKWQTLFKLSPRPTKKHARELQKKDTITKSRVDTSYKITSSKKKSPQKKP